MIGPAVFSRIDDQLRPRELPLEPPRPPVERPLVPRPLLPLLPLLPVLPPVRPLALIPPVLLRPGAERELPELPRELPDALRDALEPPDALREPPEAREPPDALRPDELPLPAPRLLPDAERPLVDELPLDVALLALPAPRPLAPRLRVRSSTSPVSALNAACVESSDVIPRPIVRLRPDPELLLLPVLPAFDPPLRFEAMPTSR